MDSNKEENPSGGHQFDHPGDPPVNDDDVVISGMSSLMPGCENLKEWAEKLYNKENMVTTNTTRWDYTHPELTEYMGEVPGIHRCDTQFFKINAKTGHAVDPGSRKLLEQAYQALFDAGICPAEVSRKRVGVFIAVSRFESESFCSRVTPMMIIGSNRAMFANRISYWLNVRGPSYVIDAACSGSMVALARALEAIRSGQCESAIVGAVKIVLHPMTLIHHNRAMLMNSDGKTKCYDINADGTSITESVSVIYLQKYKDARRVYAQLCHVKCEYSEGLDKNFSTNFGYRRNPEAISKFLRSFYKEADVAPSSVEYVEGFGSGDPDIDKIELQVIEEVFCQERTSDDPLLVGSVSSNMGLTDAVSGLNGIIKILHGYQTGVLAANLNCENPRQDIPAIRDGRIQIVNEHRPIRQSYTALNSFSVSGLNAHALLKGHYKNKDISKYKCDLPYLVTVSGRQMSGVQKVLNSIKSNNLDSEELALLREVYKMPISHHLGRGFGLYESDNAKTVTLSEKVSNNCDETLRPLWFVYSGMGSQWIGMGAKLMRIPIFADAILRCDKVLKPKGINIVEIITSNDKKIFDNFLNVFVGIASIQIALTDVLKAVGMVADGLIGYSLGELGCAYADNCLTTEEAILVSYSRGLVSVQIPFIKGSMVAVGMGFKEISKLCPPEIEVACHNGPSSSTLSGPAENVKEFVKVLTERGIFAKEVNCANIAFHSRHIAQAGDTFLKMSQDIIKKPKLRSQRWISTSVPAEGWNNVDAKFSSAEYHTNNLLNPVLFEEGCKRIPNGAVLVEIAPHGLLQAILKRSLPSDCSNVALTNRLHPDASLHLLEALGKLYVEGCNVDMRVLYSKIEYPVSTGTRQLSHLVEHFHNDQWSYCRYTPPEKKFTTIYKPIVTVYDDEFRYLKGAVIEGKNVFPFAGILIFVWDTLAMSLGKMRKLSVEFKDVRLYKESFVSDNCPINFTISLSKQSGKFEVREEPNGLVADGIIKAYNSSGLESLITTDEFQLAKNDFYKLLHEKGYEYTNELQSIHRANISLTKAEIEWHDNWTTFIDGIFQLLALRQDHDGVSQPSFVSQIVIDVGKQVKAKNSLITANHCEIENKTRCGGVSIDTVLFENKTPSNNKNIGFKTLKFVAFDQENNNNVLTNLYIAMQIVAQHVGSTTIKILSIENEKQTDILSKVNDNLENESHIKIDVTYVDDTEAIKTRDFMDKPDIVFIKHIINKEIFNELLLSFQGEIFLLLLGVESKYVNLRLFKSIFKVDCKEEYLEMFKSVQSQKSENIVFPVKNTQELDRLKKMRKDLSLTQSVTVLTNYPPIPGVKEVVQQMRVEDGYQAHLAMINNKRSELDLKKLHNLDLAVNVFLNGKWGGEYYVPLEELQTKSKNVSLLIGKHGNLNSFYWEEMHAENKQGLKVKIHFAGLNVSDAKRANGECALNNNHFGMDFSGLTDRKVPVMGIVPGGAACSSINFKTGLLWPVPRHWSMEDAATVPLPYSLAFYCLGLKLKLVRGMNVMIHGGAGALGQAAISIALAHNCTVFTTVSDHSKKRFLRELFPDLPGKHIGNSRDESFRNMVQILTKGNGCEIIISNVKGNLKNATLHCCAMAGTTFDLVQIHERNDFQYGMSFMTKARSYCIVDFSSVFNRANEDDLKKLQWMVSDGIARGYVRPLSRVTYAPYEISRAFRLLAGSRHRGRVLLRLRDKQPTAKQRVVCQPEASYLIVCDPDGFGLKLADKLIASGAKKLHIHLSSPLPHIFYKLQRWIKLGAKIEITSTGLNNDNTLETLFEKLNATGPIDGVFIIREEPSVLLKLDDVSRKLCPHLRYFVLINGKETAMHVSQKRFQNGLPAVAVNISIKKINEINEERYRFEWNRAVDVIEIAAQAKEPNVLVYVKQHKQKDIIEEISKIPGVRLTSNTADRVTLEKVGIDYGRSQEFCNSISNKFDIKIDRDIVPHLTIAQLKNLGKEATINIQENQGIEGYFNSIYPDERIANIELVPMPTMLINANMRADELVIQDAHMFIVPGLEGHHGRFKTFCKRLKIAAAVLQLGYENQNETIQETAQRFSNVILHKLKYKNHFYLLGYEYGVPIVLEIAAILESYGLTGTVYVLGGSPEEISEDIENRLDGVTEMELQNSIIRHYCSLATQNSAIDGEEFFKQMKFENKVRLCSKKIQDQIQFHYQYLSDVIVSSYSRIGFVRNYKSNIPPLKSNVILIRPFPPTVRIASNFPVTASYELHSTMNEILDDMKCPSIINKHLKTLEDFYSRNLCESYLANSEDAFIKFGIPNYQS